jgi:hypothetical protein
LAEPSRVIVADAGPLIALGRIDALQLLHRMFARVEVTETVVSECLARPELPDAKRIAAAIADNWLTPYPDVPGLVDERIHSGEASTIARALETGFGVLMDDRAGVVHARGRGLKVIGTLGALILAKRRGHVEQVADLIDRLRAGGHYLSDGAVRAALLAAGETPTD